MRRIALTPAAAILIVLFAGPLAIVAFHSLHGRGAYGGVTAVWTISNYLRLTDSLYIAIFFRTFLMAATATTVCLLLGFPLALFISRARTRKVLYLQLVTLPFWTSFLLRTYAWMFLLRDTGLINTALLATGLIREPLPLLYNEGAVLLGLVYNYLPFVVLPLFATLERLDPALIEASADLGATPWQTTLRVVLPLSAPGLWAAALLVFIPCLGAYLTPDLLGGGRTVLAGNLIQNQFTAARDWPFGSAVSLALMLLVAGLLALYLRRRGDELL